MIGKSNLQKCETIRHDSAESNEVQNDFEKLMKICNSYGLNEQETSQLISQFKRGALFQQETSVNDYFNDSCYDMTFHQKPQEEQYSFKDHQDRNHRQEQLTISQEQQDQPEEQESQRNYPDTNQFSQFKDSRQFQHLLRQKEGLEKMIYSELRNKNEELKMEVAKKQEKIQCLLGMKKQDSQIILGLKDIIQKLTESLREKEGSQRQLQEKYNSMLESRVNEKEKRSSTQYFDNETELMDSTNLHQNRNASKLRQSGELSSKHVFKENREMRELHDARQKDSRKTGKVDVKKYKGMIQNLRSNFDQYR